VLTPDLLPAEVRGADGGDAEEGARLLTLPRAGLRFETLEKDLLIQAMERARGNKSKAATFLGLSRATLRYRLEKHGLE
ncbi:MAG: AAA family ATPase, partial [Candidatus Sumerlaeia bacterium]|nr:AAA family ATPase [Candidatus Sumerlaeia bacterium]